MNKLLLLVLVALAALAFLYFQPSYSPTDVSLDDPSLPEMVVKDNMVQCPAGEFIMGHGRATASIIAHRVRLSAFWIDVKEVTNRDFEAFVEETKYVTQAELAGWATVIDLSAGTWKKVEGADWRHPQGPQSTLVGRADHPVVQVTWHDAVVYADWAKKRLPTEAEWEYAARAGLFGREHSWSANAYAPARANYWQGLMPNLLRPQDGYRGTAPVGSFPANRFGIHDMSGNVWEWCNDWHSSRYYERSPNDDPKGPKTGKHRVIRGGSWASTLEEVSVWHRHAFAPHFCNDQIGFRCAK